MLKQDNPRIIYKPPHMSFIRRFFEYLNQEKHYPFFILAFSAFVLFFELQGSIGNWDESIYGEVAKEGLARNDWLSFFYKKELWFEKPPLVIWLTMISYKIFGISEFSTWLFPVIFGILGTLGVYFVARHMFNSKTGLLSALILIAIPHYVVMARNNMMDIYLFAQLIWAFFFLLKTREDGKYLILVSLSLAFAFLTKSFASFVIYPVMFIWVYLNGGMDKVNKRHIIYSLGLFLILILPWHIFMYMNYGWKFLETYIGVHVIRRFNTNLLGLDYASDNFYYIKVLLQQSGSWWFAFLALLPMIFLNLVKKISFKEIMILLIWLGSLMLFYSISRTKLHHYLIPIYAPLSILIAYGFYEAYRRTSVFILMPLFVILMNIDKAVIWEASSFGEARLIFPVILYKYFHLSEIIVFLAVAILIIGVTHIYFKISKKLASGISIASVFLFSFIIPFRPDRAPLAKEIGEKVKGQEITAIRHIDYKNLNIDGSLVFYVDPVKVIGYRSKIWNRFDDKSSIYCLIDRSSPDKPRTQLAYDFYPCSLK